MPRDVEQLVLTLSADMRRFERQMERAAQVTDRQLGAVERRAQEANRELARFGSSIGNGIGRAAALTNIALGAIIAQSVRLAGAAEEVRSAFRVAFADGANDAQRFATTLSQTAGRDVIELQQNMTQLQLILNGVGVTGRQSLEAVQALTQRAVDISSFYDVNQADAFRAVISGITGETEPLRRFGVVLNQAAIEAELLRLGFRGNASQAGEAAKAVARYNLILDGTSRAQGDAERTADSLSNSTRRAQAEFNNASRALGEQLLPLMSQGMRVAADLARGFNSLTDSQRLWALGAVAAAANIVPLISMLSQLTTAAITARAAMAALDVQRGRSAQGPRRDGTPGVPPLVPVGGGPLARLGVGAATIAAGGGALTAGDDTRRTIRALETASSASRLRAAASDRLAEALTYYTERAEGGDAAAQQTVARIRAEYQRRGVSLRSADARPVTLADLELSDAQSAAATARLALTPVQLRPVGGAGGGPRRTGPAGRGTSGPSTAEVAEREAQRLDSVQEQIYRARVAELGFHNTELRTLEERHAFDLELLDMARARRATELDGQVRRKEINEAERRQIEEAEALADQAERRTLQDRYSLQRQDALAEHEREIASLSIEVLASQRDAATTAAERRDIELRLLAETRRLERDRLASDLARNPSLTPEQRQARLGGFDQVTGAMQQSVMRDTRGPLEAWVAENTSAAARVREAYEQVAVRGLDAISDSLVDAITGARDLGEAFSEVAQQILRDLAQIAIRQSITQPLANALLGSFGGGGKSASWFSGGDVGSFGGFRASGGPVSPGKGYIVGERGPEWFRPAVSGAILSSDAVLRAAAAPIGATSQALHQHVTVRVDARDAVLTQTVQGWVMEGMQAVGAAGALSLKRYDEMRYRRKRQSLRRA